MDSITEVVSQGIEKEVTLLTNLHETLDKNIQTHNEKPRNRLIKRNVIKELEKQYPTLQKAFMEQEEYCTELDKETALMFIKECHKAYSSGLKDKQAIMEIYQSKLMAS